MASPPEKRVIERVLTFDRDEMAERGRKGGRATRDRHDSRTVTANARAAFLSRFDQEVDPEGVLAPEERAARAAEARRAYFAELGRRGGSARPQVSGEVVA